MSGLLHRRIGPNIKSQHDYAIGTDSTQLVRLRDMGIPYPDQAILAPFQQTIVRGDNTRVGEGVSSLTWTWDVMAIEELAKIFIALGVTVQEAFKSNIFIRTNVTNGFFADPQFNEYQGILWIPLLSGQDGSPVAKSTLAWQTTRLTFMNVIVSPEET